MCFFYPVLFFDTFQFMRFKSFSAYIFYKELDFFLGLNCKTILC